MPASVAYRVEYSSRLQHVTQVMSQTEFARLVGVSKSAVSRWSDGSDIPSESNARLLLDVDYILGQYAQSYPAERFRRWLSSANAFLDGARPRDVLVLEGPTRVLEALHAEVAGSFA